MSDKLTNGEGQKSHFVAHITSYPLVSDGISTYKSNPYGQKSLSLANDIYARFAGPLLPYLRGPYSYVSPYVAKADELGDNGLKQIDSRFPIVNTDTETVKNTVLDYALFPLRVANEGKDYVLGTYDSEGKKIQGKGLPHLVKTVISTEMKIALDALSVVAQYLGPKKDKAQNKIQETSEQIKDKTSNLSEKTSQVSQDLTNQAKDKTEQAKDKTNQAKHEVNSQAKDKTNQAKHEVNKAKQ